MAKAEVVLNPTPTVNETVQTGFNARTYLSGGNVYSWEKVDDATKSLDLRFRLLRVSSTPTTPASSGTVISDTANDASSYFVDSVAYDSTYLYQCTSIGGTRVRLDATDATPTKIFATPSGVKSGDLTCAAIAIGATNLYLVNRNQGTGIDTIYTVPLNDLSPTTVPTLVPKIGDRIHISNLTVIGSNLFWLDFDLSGDASSPNLVTAPVTGAAPVTVDTDLANTDASIATDGAYLYWSYTPLAVAEVRRTPLPYVPGAKPQVIAQDFDSLKPGIVMDSNYLYVMEANNASGRVVYRVKKDGSETKQLGIAAINDSNGQHQGLQMTGVDASYVYFLLFDGLLARLPNGS